MPSALYSNVPRVIAARQMVALAAQRSGAGSVAKWRDLSELPARCNGGSLPLVVVSAILLLSYCYPTAVLPHVYRTLTARVPHGEYTESRR